MDIGSFLTRPSRISRRAAGTCFEQNFGPPAENAAYRKIYDSLDDLRFDLDRFALAACNHVVLELTYQTRFIASGALADAVVFVGGRNDFPVIINNHNIVFGLLITNGDTHSFDVPAWVAQHGRIEISKPLLAESDITNAKNALAVNNRRHLGAIIIDLESIVCSTWLDFAGFDALGEFVSKYTSILFVGVSGSVVHVYDQIRHLDGECDIKIRLYHDDEHDCLRGLILVQGLSRFPPIKRQTSVPRRFTFCRILGDTKPPSEHAEHVEYLPYEEAVCRKPIAVFASSPLPDEIARHTSMRSHLFHHAVIVPNGVAIPFHGSAVSSTIVYSTGDGRLIEDFGNEQTAIRKTPLWSNSTLDGHGVRTVDFDVGRFKRVPGSAIPLQFTPFLHHWFSHFMIQCLPRVLLLDLLHKPDAKIVVPDTIRTKQLDMLVHAGIPKNRIVRIPETTPWQADELIVPMAWPLVFSSTTMSVFDRIKANIKHDPPRGDTPKRILISREMRKSWRNLINAKDIEEILVEERGFTVIRPETLSLQDEIVLFENAEIVVGAEGAGLYGGCFASPGAVFVSISDEDYAMPILASIAQFRQFEIIYVFGESFRSDLDLARRLPFGHTDFVVNPDDVVQAVDAAILFRSSSAPSGRAELSPS